MENKQRILLIVLAVVAVLSIGTAAYFIMHSKELTEQNKTLEDEKVELETEIQELDTKIKSLEEELSNKNVELEEKDQKLEELTKKLTYTRARINKLIKQGKLSQKQIEQYKFKMEQMQYYIEKYKKQIAELKRENEILKEQNTQLSEEVKQKDSIAYELEQQNTLYETKLKSAAVLKAVEFEFISINKRNKEKKEIPVHARRTATLKVCFKILDNPVAEAGKRDVVLVLKDPSGNVYKNLAGGSGYFTYNNSDIPYSAKRTISYDKTAKKVCINYSFPEEAKIRKGRNKAEIYIDGYLVGSKSFEVK